MLRVSSTVRRTETADGAILMDVHQGRIFCLNAMGEKILEFLERGCDEAFIAEEIHGECGMSLNVVRADVAQFIETLKKHHIVKLV